MRDQGLQIQHSMGEEPHRRRPRVMVTVDELQIDLFPPPSNHCPTVPVDEAQKILWELTELNFRFELLALDKRASGLSSH